MAFDFKKDKKMLSNLYLDLNNFIGYWLRDEELTEADWDAIVNGVEERVQYFKKIYPGEDKTFQFFLHQYNKAVDILNQAEKLKKGTIDHNGLY